MNSQGLDIVNVGADKRHMKDISRLSVDIVKWARASYPEHIVAALSLIAKYMTIAALPKKQRKDIADVVNPKYCPLCELYFGISSCKGCVLVSENGIYCGDRYNDLRSTLENGTFTEVAFHVGKIAQDILKIKE